MSLLRQSAKRLLTSCVPLRWLVARAPACAAGERPRLALTFDDGPHPHCTPPLLDLLETAGIPATFFVVGDSAARHPDLVRRIAGDGHEIGNHTWFHGEPHSTPPRRFLDEVRQTDAFLRSLTGVLPQAMRPPRGELNWGKLTGLWRLEKTVALWSVDPRDYGMSDMDEIVDWGERYEPQDGDVLLFHDNHPWAMTAITVLLRRGVFDHFRAVTISELVGRRSPSAARPPRLVESAALNS